MKGNVTEQATAAGKRQGVTCHIAVGLTFNRFSVFKTPHLKAPKAQVVLVSFEEQSSAMCLTPVPASGDCSV